jgi:hypothetical protein
MNKFDKIYSKKEYLEYFEGEAENSNTKISEALKVALDTRKFEIELYWKRATYFWAFIAATFTGYFVLLTSDNIDSFRGFTIKVSFIGVMFSLGWYYVNRGSKHWQENWERHEAYLEQKVHGPLFGVVKYNEEKFWDLNKGYPFSVSKVNQLLSLIIFVIWVILFVFSVFYSFDKLLYLNYESEEIPMVLPILICLLSLIPLYYFTKYSFSFLINDKKEINNIFTEKELMKKKESIKFVKKN